MPNILSENAETIAKARYFLEDENWEGCSLRVATAAATAEGDKQKEYIDIFHEMIFNRDFLPAGRILRNSGRSKGSLFNCYNLPVGDSIEEIGQLIKDALILWSDGGGVGINFSSLRPKGDYIKGKGGHSSGLVSFIEAVDSVAKTIESGGSRRAAAIAHVDISHPEVMDFIDAKLVHGRLSCFNISVSITNEFIEAVESDDIWQFKFQQKNYGSIKARKIWDKIIKNMINCAEPGLVNWDNLTKNNSYYFAPILGTNPCISKGTLISTDKGLIPVEKLCDKEFVVTTDLKCINQQGSFNEKARCWNSGNKDVFKITLKNNQSVTLTDNHKVFVKDGDMIIKKEVKDLNIDDTMIIQNTISPHHISDSIDQDEFENGLLVGWMLGDGWISDAYKDIKSNRTSMGFIVGESEIKAKEFLKKKINELKADWELPVGWLNSSGGAKSFEMSSSSKEVQKFFSKYGYRSNNDNKTIPDEILTQPHSFKRGFIAGLYSADGWCDTYKHNSKSQRIGFSSCKEDIVDKVQILLNEFGIISIKGSGVIKCNLNDKWYNHYNLTISTASDCMKYMKEIGFHLSEKKQISGVNFTTSKWHMKYNGFKKIKNIEYVGKEDTYDINTDVTHSLIANGILISNCGEIPLEAYGVCCLGSLKLPNFITGSVNTNWKKLSTTIKNSVRFLDNIIDVSKYSLEQININAHNSRRIGLGVMGLAEYLFAKGLRYGSDKANHEIERTMRFIRDEAVLASIELAIEKGAFPKFDPVAYGKASFIRKLPASLRMKIKEHGIRNCTILTAAPTGTIALIAECSSGIEPLFSKGYVRKDRVGERVYIHPMYIDFVNNGEEIPDWFVDAYDLKAEDHFEVQAMIQKYIDSSVSKTINLRHNTTEEDLSKLLLTYITDLKGTTVYRDGSREGQILNPISKEEVMEYIKKNNITSNRDDGDVKCSNGKCGI